MFIQDVAFPIKLPSTRKTTIHPTALIASTAILGEGTVVGPRVIIEDNVVIGAHCTIEANAVIESAVVMGDHNYIGYGAIIGNRPQDLKYAGESSQVVIGAHNQIREYVTINRGTKGGGLITRIGDYNIIMSYSHVAHDCQIMNHVVISNACNMAGHVVLEDWATVGGVVAIHQFVRVGTMSMVGAHSWLNKDVPPYCTVVGNPAYLYGLNSERLRRNAVSASDRILLKRIYHAFFQRGVSGENIQAQMAEEINHSLAGQTMLSFVQETRRGHYKVASQKDKLCQS